jgi:hypothetical protein
MRVSAADDIEINKGKLDDVSISLTAKKIKN